MLSTPTAFQFFSFLATLTSHMVISTKHTRLFTYWLQCYIGLCLSSWGQPESNLSTFHLFTNSSKAVFITCWLCIHWHKFADNTEQHLAVSTGSCLFGLTGFQNVNHTTAAYLLLPCLILCTSTIAYGILFFSQWPLLLLYTFRLVSGLPRSI